MTSKIFRKIVETLAALIALSFLTFLFLHFMPGGPFDEDVSFNPLVRENLQKQWSLDQPFLVQYFLYLKNLMGGNFGTSMVQTGRSVADVLTGDMAQTVALNSLALLGAYFFAFFSSAYAALNPHRIWARLLEGMNVIAISMPSLFLGPVLIYVFGFYFNLLPTAFLTSPRHYILPVLTLGLRPWAQINLLLTNSLRESLRQDFVRTARAKGVRRRDILFRHALKNSMMPLMSLSGPLIVSLISGSFLVEIIFSIPGLGRQFVESLNLRDYPVVMALVLVYGTSLILLTHVFDGMAWSLDPRLRRGA
jgi:oligopeptide transport system permease protein